MSFSVTNSQNGDECRHEVAFRSFMNTSVQSWPILKFIAAGSGTLSPTYRGCQSPNGSQLLGVMSYDLPDFLHTIPSTGSINFLIGREFFVVRQN